MIHGQVQQLTLTTPRKQWRFPKSRFVQFEDKDESWCRFFGIGEEVTVNEETVFPQAVVEEVVFITDGLIQSSSMKLRVFSKE